MESDARSRCSLGQHPNSSFFSCLESENVFLLFCREEDLGGRQFCECQHTGGKGEVGYSMILTEVDQGRSRKPPAAEVISTSMARSMFPQGIPLSARPKAQAPYPPIEQTVLKTEALSFSRALAPLPFAASHSFYFPDSLTKPT